MQAVLLVIAIFGSALAIPPKEIHVPAPKTVVRTKQALQEHAVNVKQAVPIKKTLVRTINVPKDIIHEVPVHVFTDLVLKSPVPRKKIIDIKKTVLQPHIKRVGVDAPYYVRRKIPVIHNKIQRVPRLIPRVITIPRVRVINKLLHRIVDVPQIVHKERVHHVDRPVPFVRQRVQHVDVDVPFKITIPEPVVMDRHTHSVETVAVPQDVIQKVAVPRDVVLKELVPVPEKAAGTASAATRVIEMGANHQAAQAAAQQVIESNRNIQPGPGRVAGPAVTVSVGRPRPVEPIDIGGVGGAAIGGGAVGIAQGGAGIVQGGAGIIQGEAGIVQGGAGIIADADDTFSAAGDIGFAGAGGEVIGDGYIPIPQRRVSTSTIVTSTGGASIPAPEPILAGAGVADIGGISGAGLTIESSGGVGPAIGAGGILQDDFIGGGGGSGGVDLTYIGAPGVATREEIRAVGAGVPSGASGLIGSGGIPGSGTYIPDVLGGGGFTGGVGGAAGAILDPAGGIGSVGGASLDIGSDGIIGDGGAFGAGGSGAFGAGDGGAIGAGEVFAAGSPIGSGGGIIRRSFSVGSSGGGQYLGPTYGQRYERRIRKGPIPYTTYR